MKKFFVFISLFFLIFALYAKGIQEDYRQAEENARLSYAFGMLFGFNLPDDLEIDFDYKAIADGIRDVIESSQTHLTEQEAIEIIETALHVSREKVSAENRAHEESFLALNRQKEGIHITQSGLQYEIIFESNQKKPESNSVVKVNYEGVFLDGSQFDKSEEEGAFIPMEMIIPGWAEGLSLMGVGSAYRFYIPSALAYGRDGIYGIIPPYSTLIIDVELLEIVDYEDGDVDF